MRVALALLVVLVPAAAAAQPAAAPATPIPAASSAPDTGLMLEIRYIPGSSAHIVNFNFGSGDPSPETNSGLFAGYQLARISFGVGLELARSSSHADVQGGGESGESAITYLILPGARVTLGRSHDGRAEVIGLVDIGWGESTFSTEDQFNTQDVTYDRFRFQIGPGLRYWPAQSVGFGVAALIRHDRVYWNEEFSAIDHTATRTDLTMSLSATGVF
jgi:hypothetical protein